MAWFLEGGMSGSWAALREWQTVQEYTKFLQAVSCLGASKYFGMAHPRGSWWDGNARRG
jgi:hypothetical protein